MNTDDPIHYCNIVLAVVYMAQTPGKMFDKVLHYFFQNVTPKYKLAKDEERILSTTDDLKIEVSCGRLTAAVKNK